MKHLELFENMKKEANPQKINEIKFRCFNAVKKIAKSSKSDSDKITDILDEYKKCEEDIQKYKDKFK